MKLSSKTLLRLAAIGLAIINTYWLIDKLFHVFLSLNDHWRDIVSGTAYISTIVCITIALFVVYKQRNAMPTQDKRFRIMTYLTAGLLLLRLICAHVTNHHGMYLIHTPYWIWNIANIAILIWLWMFSNRTGEETLTKPVAIIILCGGIAFLLPLTLTVIDNIPPSIFFLIGKLWGGNIGDFFISLCTQQILPGFSRFAYFNWLMTIAPVITFESYALSTIKHK